VASQEIGELGDDDDEDEVVRELEPVHPALALLILVGAKARWLPPPPPGTH
jgi:hypothetical protein